MKKAPWNRIPYLIALWNTLHHTRRRIFNEHLQVLIYTKDNGTHWADIIGLSNEQIRKLEEQQ